MDMPPGEKVREKMRRTPSNAPREVMRRVINRKVFSVSRYLIPALLLLTLARFSPQAAAQTPEITVTLSVPDNIASEADATDKAQIRLTISEALQSTEDLNVVLSLGGVKRGEYYTLESGGVTNTGSVEFDDDGETAITVELTATIDDNDTDDIVTVSIGPTSFSPSHALQTRGATIKHVIDGSTDITLLDAHLKSTASFASASSSVSESLADFHNVQVNFSPALRQNVANLEFTKGGTATSGGTDYSAQVISPPKAGATSANIIVIISEDNAAESDETAVLTLTAAADARYTVGSPASHTVTITDNDGTRTPPPANPTVSFASASSSAAEDAGSVNVAVNLSPAPTSAITVSYTVGGTATSGTDFAALSGSVPVASNATSVNIPVAITDDSADESDETVILTLTTGSDYAVGSTSAHTLTITDDDDPPVVTPVITISGGNAVTEGAAATFTVTADTAPSANLTVNLTVSENASGGRDFVAAGDEGNKTAPIPANMSSATYSVDTVGDSTDEPNGSVTVTVKAGSGYTIGVNSSASVTVNDNDDSGGTPPPANPTVSFASASSTRAEDAGSVNVAVNLSPAPTSGITVNYTVGGTAASGTDFAALSGSVSVASGATSVNIPVSITDDSADESDETVVLTLTAGSGYAVGSTSAHTLTITDNDSSGGGTPPPANPTVSFASASSSVGEDTGSVNVAVNLSPAPTSGITVNYTVGGTATSGTDFGVLSGSVSVASGATSVNIPVSITDDSADESDETVILTLTAGSGYAVGSTSAHTLTITDNDSGGGTPTPANPVVSFASSSSRAAEDAGSVNVAVNLSPAPTSEMTVNYTTGGTAASGADFAALSGSVQVASGATSVNIPVAITDDSADESEETVVLTLTAGSGYDVGSTSEHALTITDNDDPATSAEDSEIPSAFALAQNYPNPFNPSTTIEFSLDKAQRVSLVVYDVLGHEVRTLMEGVQPAARYSVSFDASHLASGPYLYVLRTEEQTAVRKMSLLK